MLGWIAVDRVPERPPDAEQISLPADRVAIVPRPVMFG